MEVTRHAPPVILGGEHHDQRPWRNVTELIDERGFGRFQFLVALWCGFLLIIDGFAIRTIAYVVPVMAPQGM